MSNIKPVFLNPDEAYKRIHHHYSRGEPVPIEYIVSYFDDYELQRKLVLCEAFGDMKAMGYLKRLGHTEEAWLDAYNQFRAVTGLFEEFAEFAEKAIADGVAEAELQAFIMAPFQPRFEALNENQKETLTVLYGLAQGG